MHVHSRGPADGGAEVHVSTSIQADDVVVSVAAEAHASIERLFPDQLGDEADAPARDSGEPAQMDPPSACPVYATHEGYLQTIDADRLMTLARVHDLELRIPARPGAFVTESTPVMLGSHRTLTQDAEHGICQLAEIAVRSPSPGINDPFTALSSLDRLEALLCRLAGRRFPSPYRCDDSGHLPIVADIPSYGGFVDAALTLIRENAGWSPRVLLRILDLVDGVARSARTADQRAALREHAWRTRACCVHHFHEEHELRELEERYRRALASLDAAPPSRALLTRSA